MTIWFDMDGTIADLYGQENWLADLLNGYNRPYRMARPLLNMREFGSILRKLQNAGYEIGIISWLSKNSNAEYDHKVIKAKMNWLDKHLGSVEFDAIHIVPYGTPKFVFADESDILFDDEKPNRDSWIGKAYDVNNIMEILASL